jgi:hypothetical protein
MPYQSGQSVSPREIGLQLALSQLSKNPEDTALGMGTAAMLGSHTITTIQAARSEGLLADTEVLERLDKAGYDKDSDFAKSVVHTSAAFNAVFVDMAQAVGKLIKS